MDSHKNATGQKGPTEQQAKDEYNNLSAEQKKKQTYTEWVKENYNYQYERWMPWIEDQYLKWFGKGDNKASYAAKRTNSSPTLPLPQAPPHLPRKSANTSNTEQLDKTKVTGISQVDQIQDDVNNLVGNQLGSKGLLAPVTNMASKEGIDRAERGGKDDKGTYGGPVAGYSDPVLEKGQAAGQGIAGGAQKVGGGVVDGVKGGAGYLGGLAGGGKK
jgi:hypothetical protein